MTDKPTSDPASEKTKARKTNEAVAKTPNNWTARISLMIAMVALGAAGYLGYQLIYLQPFASQSAKTQAALSDLKKQMQQELDAATKSTERSVTNLGAELEKQNREVQEDLRSAVAESLAAAEANRPTPPRQWRLSEAAFLLRMANYWLQFEGDVQIARQTLQRADEVLQSVQNSAKQDEYDLLPVRSALAQEILALQQVRPVDVQGIFLRLQALADRVPAVREALQLNPKVSAPETEQPLTALAAVTRELEKFVRITNLSELRAEDGATGESTLGPEETMAARLAVITALELAQVAALRRQSDAYQASITDAIAAAKRLAPPSDPQAQQYVVSLSAMRDEPLTAPVPNISGSLGELTRLMDAYR